MRTNQETEQDVPVIKLPKTSDLPMTAEGIVEDLTDYLRRHCGDQNISIDAVYQSVVFAVRSRLLERQSKTQTAVEQAQGSSVAYLSLEFLMGRLLRNALLNLDLDKELKTALDNLGLQMEEVQEREPDAGLGNGGLGRLAACFLDSCATLSLPVTAYGIRYHYGMFHQLIEDGHQIEKPDEWLKAGFPWERQRKDLSQTVQFGGHSESYDSDDGRTRYRWVDSQDVKAIPYDVPIPGYKNDVVNTLRLWSATALEDFDLSEFNAGSHSAAVASKTEAEKITMVLYPNANTETGHELRLRQQYFLTAASLQDILKRWVEDHGADFAEFGQRNTFQLNDTHPAVAVAELMRLLMDHHDLTWEDAWSITTKTMAYTNHTLLPEALEVWPVALFRRLLPRHLDIILEINSRFLKQISKRWPDDSERIRRMSLIEESHEPLIRMAFLAIVGSFSVNGVAALHSELLIDGLFKDFAELWPQKFNNKTNGVTQRRWLAACNPSLRRLITEKIGDTWVTHLSELEKLQTHINDPDFQQRWRLAKLANKKRLATQIMEKTGIDLPTHMLFDVQVKRIHEYKRQVLNMLHAVHLYDRIRRGDDNDLPARAIIIGGKAAPGYDMAKNIIKCINSVATVINNDPLTKDKLRLVFYPDYNVSAMEVICPGADLSEQISTAGKEASGTGNMKFMMNGAVTVGTLDGANVEILDAVGQENFFLFGLTVDEVQKLRQQYDPDTIIAADADFVAVMEALEGGLFDGDEPGVFDAITQSIRDPKDPWVTAADFGSFIQAQKRVNKAWLNEENWTRMSILNTAASGRFSTDRTIQDYNNEIWKLDPITLS